MVIQACCFIVKCGGRFIFNFVANTEVQNNIFVAVILLALLPLSNNYIMQRSGVAFRCFFLIFSSSVPVLHLLSVSFYGSSSPFGSLFLFSFYTILLGYPERQSSRSIWPCSCRISARTLSFRFEFSSLLPREFRNIGMRLDMSRQIAILQPLFLTTCSLAGVLRQP
jgi:hypothetical protein